MTNENIENNELDQKKSLSDKMTEKADKTVDNVKESAKKAVASKVPGSGMLKDTGAKNDTSGNEGLLNGDSIQEKTQDAVAKTQTATVVATKAFALTFNPVTWIVIGVAIALLLTAAVVMAGSQTVGRNPNACENGEDCAVLKNKCSSAGGEVSELVGSNNVEKIYNYFVGIGYNPMVAAGIAGNFRAESGENVVPWIAEYPSSYVGAWVPGSGFVTGQYRDGRGVGGWGIAQWSFGRHHTLKAKVISELGNQYYVSQHTNGNPPMSQEMESKLLKVQLDFVVEELSATNYLEELKSKQSPAEAAMFFHDKYERSADTLAMKLRRSTYAQEVYDTYGSGTGECSSSSGEWVNPTEGGVLTSPYGWRIHPITGILKMHTGLDWGLACGVPQKSVSSGVVSKSGYFGGYGNQIHIDHGDGVVSSYAHLNAISPLSVGTNVQAGEVIGYTGTTGSSTGCHMHLEIRINNVHTDPKAFLAEKGVVL